MTSSELDWPGIGNPDPLLLTVQRQEARLLPTWPLGLGRQTPPCLGCGMAPTRARVDVKGSAPVLMNAGEWNAAGLGQGAMGASGRGASRPQIAGRLP